MDVGTHVPIFNGTPVSTFDCFCCTACTGGHLPFKCTPPNRTCQWKHLEQHRITLLGSLTPAAFVLPIVYAMRTRILMGSAIFFPTRGSCATMQHASATNRAGHPCLLVSMCLGCEAKIETTMSIRFGNKEGYGRETYRLLPSSEVVVLYSSFSSSVNVSHLLAFWLFLHR
jgi:hypothetical protein